MQNIDINQARHRLPELVEQTITGNEIILTKGGRPVAKIVGIPNPKKQRHCGAAKGLIKISADFDKPLEDFQEYI